MCVGEMRAGDAEYHTYHSSMSHVVHDSVMYDTFDADEDMRKSFAGKATKFISNSICCAHSECFMHA